MYTVKALILFFVTFTSGLASAEPKIAPLEIGDTGYELSEERATPLMVMIHGVSGPMTIWDKNYDYLVNQGFQVLRYDLLGRGQSERIEQEYDNSLFQNQLEELLRFLNYTDRDLIFIASSMGNIIASEFAERHPNQVVSMIMIGPAGFNMGDSVSSRLSQYPYIGEAMTCLFGHKIMMERNKEYFYDASSFEQFLNDYEKQLKIKGSKKAILSTMRNMPVKDYSDGYQRLAEFNIPTLIIWGKNDISFDFKFSDDLRKIINHADFIPISKAAHLPMLEKAIEVNTAILSFLKENI